MAGCSSPAPRSCFSKYPWSGGLPPAARPHPAKFGILTSEIELFAEVAAATGLVQHGPGHWCRHPLAYLTEAADDICYLVVDIEDAVQMEAPAFAEAEDLLSPLAAIEPPVYRTLEGTERKLTYLRARAISTLITGTIGVWRDRHDRMLRAMGSAPCSTRRRKSRCSTASSRSAGARSIAAPAAPRRC